MTPFLAWLEEYLQKFLTQRIMILSLEILTQRIDYCEQKYDSKNWTFESVTQSTEPSFSIWVNESNPLFQYESKTWTFFWLEELNFFWILIQRIELFWIWRKELNLFSWIWRKDWSFSLKFWQQRIELSFQKWLNELNMTQRIEPFFFQFDSKNWTFCLFQNVTQRIELLNSFTNMAYSKSSTHLNLFIWLNELDLFYMTLRIEPDWIITQRIESSFSWLKELNPLKRLNELNIFVIQRIVLSLLNVIQRIESFLLNVTQRIESLLKNMKNSLIWSKERIEILWYDTKDWIFLIWLTEPNTFNITQRIESFSPIDSKKWTFSNWLKEVNFFIWQNRTQRFDFFWYDSKNRTLFLNTTQRIEHFFNMTQRIELFSSSDSKKWTFNLTKYDPKVWFFLIWLKEPNTFLNVTQRIEPFFKHDSKNWTLFTKGLQELIFSQFFQRFEPFLTWLTELSLFWTIWLIEIEPFLSTWVKENYSFFVWLKDFLSFLQNVWLKEWIDRSWKIWLWELKIFKEKRTLRIEPFQKLTRWIEPSVLHDPKNWTFFSYITQRIGLFLHF